MAYQLEFTSLIRPSALDATFVRRYLSPMSTTPILFDHSLLAKRRARALSRPGSMADASFLRDSANLDIADRVGAVSRTFEHALNVDAVDDELSRQLLATGQVKSVELSADFKAAQIDTPCTANGDRLGGLPESAKHFDLITSVLSLQFANDLTGTLIQIRRALVPDGLFLGALIGGDTLIELRQVLLQAEEEVVGGAAPRVLPFGEVRDVGALLQRAGFALPVADIDTTKVRYSNPMRLLSDLRAMAATNILSSGAKQPLRRAVLKRAMELYVQKFAEADGKVPATFQIISLSGWAPHESQQKPLKPGSAKSRLAEALGVKEIETGQKPGES
ncbi:MAG: SAM-dependent methyltransferase [Hyphomicrobiales bacterium]